MLRRSRRVLHLLLLVILLVGPAFLAPKSKVDDMPVLDFIPAEADRCAVLRRRQSQRHAAGRSAGPTPTGRRRHAATANRPEPVENARRASPGTRQRSSNRPSPTRTRWSLTPRTKRKLLEVSTKPIIRRRRYRQDAKVADAQADSRQREARPARLIDTAQPRSLPPSAQVAANLGDEPRPGTSHRTEGPRRRRRGPMPITSRRSRAFTWHAWDPPEDTTDDDAISHGHGHHRQRWHRGLRAHHPSLRQRQRGPVRPATLDRVTFIAPLPEDAKESSAPTRSNSTSKPNE